ncbi:hypothetical protein C8Q75DRAFT_805009 [Abortiporus biennis]|nr:hypothetical protein C8Q75DRAFT_805009 [Abortiporus biennis]
MQFNFLTFASLAVLAARSFATPVSNNVTPLIVDTPLNVIQCKENIIFWEGGIAPFTILTSSEISSVLKDNSADAFLTVSDIQFTQISLVLPNTGVGETVLFKVNDSQGLTADTAFIAIGTGSNDTTCFAPALA